MTTTFFPALFFAFVNLAVCITSPLKLSCVYGEGVNSKSAAQRNCSTHLSFKVWDVGISRESSRDDNVSRVKDSYCSVGSTATYGDVPLPFLILAHLLHKSGSPYVQLQRLSVEFQPFTELTDGIGHQEHNPVTTERTL